VIVKNTADVLMLVVYAVIVNNACSMFSFAYKPHGTASAGCYLLIRHLI